MLPVDPYAEQKIYIYFGVQLDHFRISQEVIYHNMICGSPQLKQISDSCRGNFGSGVEISGSLSGVISQQHCGYPLIKSVILDEIPGHQLNFSQYR